MSQFNDTELCEVRVLRGDEERVLFVPRGTNLRLALLDADISPYAAITRRLNCGGRGLCATCSVWIDEGEPAPQHWHDRIGSAFGYPRLSCQVRVTHAMTVRILIDKRLWGDRQPARRRHRPMG